MVNPTPTPLTRRTQRFAGLWKLADEWSALLSDPLRREVNVTALTDDKALMMISCEAGAYNTIDLAWIVSRKAAGLAPGTVAFAVQQRSGDQ